MDIYLFIDLISFGSFGNIVKFCCANPGEAKFETFFGKYVCKIVQIMRSIVEVGASVPAFLGKLWKLVNDSETDHLISWSPGGKTFFIKNQADFARSLLPQYYKHNNMASFIRQLNMYGFHKITSVENGGLRYEKDDIEFSHPCFMKGHAYLLEHIKRKIANPKTLVASIQGQGEKLLVKPELMTKVLADVKSMKGKQESMDTKFSVMKQENEALWREVALLRQKHMKQQQIVNNLIQFLMSLVQPGRGGGAHGVKRRYQLMINDAAHDANYKNPKLERDLLEDLQEENLCDGPTIREMHDEHQPTSPLDPRAMVTVELAQQSAAGAQQPRTPAQYHVTMEDEDAEIVDSLLSPEAIGAEQIVGRLSTSPLTVSAMTPSPVAPSPDAALMSPSLTSTGQFSIDSADIRLPADIFASDDSGAEPAAPPELLSPLQASVNDVLLSNDDVLSGLFVQPQKIYIKKEKTEPAKTKKSSKQQLPKVDLSSIKTELQDSTDWNEMTLATVNDHDRTMNIRDFVNNNKDDRSSKHPTLKNKSDLDDHLDTMQSDLDSLRELLRSDTYSFDANTLLGLFGQEEPLYALNLSNMDDRTNQAQETNQLTSYTGSVPDFGDFSLTEDQAPEEASEDPLLGSTLNTPLISMPSPFGADK